MPEMNLNIQERIQNVDLYTIFVVNTAEARAVVMDLVIKASFLAFSWYAIKMLYTQLIKLWVESKPNEWLLVIRKGELVQCNVGLCCWTLPGDKAVSFPS